MAIGLADIIAYEKRRRATGQYVPEKFLSSAMEAYWDVEAQKAERAREFRLRERALGFEAERLRIAEEERKAAEKAQTIRGIADIGTTAAIGAYFLRGGATKTKTPVSTPSGAGGAGGAVGAKPLTYGGAGGAQRQFTLEV
ncbi:hypothetical protein FJZ33_11965, partial [Candidatus Poribacteria bacterium]|nr:hypothetical protein [Candidatus Poribacteria bacterium]